MKNISIKEVQYNDKFKIIEFLYNNYPDKIEKSTWEKLFEYKWNPLNKFGYSLEFENEIIGYFGLIFSKNLIYKDYLTANINSWYVKPAFRRYSLKLIKEVIKMNKIFFISHSTINSILDIYFFFNWKVFEESYYIFLKSFYKSNKVFNVEIINNNNPNFKNNINNKIYFDHKEYGCIFLKIYSESEELMIIGKLKKKFLTYLDIIYISDLEFFNKNAYLFVNKIKLSTNTFFLKIDSRFIKNCKNILKIKFKFKTYKKIYFCSENIKDLNLANINNIYSEYFLLNT